MGEYTFIVSKTCPICGESTRIIKLKSRIIAEKTDEDFCVHYKGINPYFYHIWFCEHCGFAADEAHFLAPMASRHKQKIRDFLQGRQLGLDFTEERGVPEAIASYKLASTTPTSSTRRSRIVPVSGCISPGSTVRQATRRMSVRRWRKLPRCTTSPS